MNLGKLIEAREFLRREWRFVWVVAVLAVVLFGGDRLSRAWYSEDPASLWRFPWWWAILLSVYDALFVEFLRLQAREPAKEMSVQRIKEMARCITIDAFAKSLIICLSLMAIATVFNVQIGESMRSATRGYDLLSKLYVGYWSYRAFVQPILDALRQTRNLGSQSKGA